MTLTTLIITDLTRMSGDRVCLAGVNPSYNSIRPEFHRGYISEAWLYNQAGQLVISPFTRVQLDLLENRPTPIYRLRNPYQPRRLIIPSPPTQSPGL